MNRIQIIKNENQKPEVYFHFKHSTKNVNIEEGFDKKYYLVFDSEDDAEFYLREVSNGILGPKECFEDYFNAISLDDVEQYLLSDYLKG